MQLQITGKQIELGDALKERIADGLEAGVSKYFERTGEATVVVSRPVRNFEVDCSIHLPSGVALQAHGEGVDAHVAFEEALAKMEKRVRRYHRRLKDHHRKAALPAEAVAEFVIQPETDEDLAEEEGGAAPTIVAENGVTLKTMTVSMAVMQLELTDAPALMFRNAASGGLNMVFRRRDGNVGWVDPGAAA